MKRSFDCALVVLVLAVLAWSAIKPYDWLTWAMEVAPALIGLAVLGALYPRFRFTRLACVLIAAHMIILIVGGHYTYARVPLFDWFKEWFGWTRNYYDRVGHFAQGFVPAILVREILRRNEVVAKRGWLPFLVVSICLAISACYEFVEWAAALLVGGSADEFLALQGDVWDTQNDMFMAVVGATCALLLLSRWHDRQLAALSKSPDTCGKPVSEVH